MSQPTDSSARPPPAPRTPRHARRRKLRRAALTLVAAMAPWLAGSWGASRSSTCTPRTAHADPSFWEQVTQEPEEAARLERYQAEMQRGHQQASLVLGEGRQRDVEPLPPLQRRQLTQEARRAFQRAARIRPTVAEPHYYLAVFTFFALHSCAQCQFDPAIATEIVEELEAFEALSPLDPRLTSLLGDRAILYTRLSGHATPAKTREYLERAIADYRAIIARSAGLRQRWELTYGNLAEALMMIGDLEEAIATYRLAQRHASTASILLGLAVAMDRDERGVEARTLIRELGPDAVASWEEDVLRGDTFYVPQGEVHYYRALIAETRGDINGAIAAYRQFEQSNAHPQFAPRAAANRAALTRAVTRAVR